MSSASGQPGEMAHAIDEAAALLRAGEVVAFPTETVYGLGADAWNATAVARVFALKGRPSNNPLIVHVSGPAMARSVASDWPAWAETLSRAFWPGPLTLVVSVRDDLPKAVTAGGSTVGVRAPNHPAAMALLYAAGGPLVGPSANRSGRVSPTSAAHVRDSFADGLFVVDGGICTAGIESTVVRWNADERLEILRPGVIGPSELAAALGIESTRVIMPTLRKGDAVHDPHDALISPGQLTVHYAPSAPAVLFARSEWGRVVEHAHGGSIALLSFGEMSVSDASLHVTMPAHAAAYAARLYAALRDADASRPDLIAIEAPPAPDPHCGGDAELWHAVADRLSRAATRFSDLPGVGD